MEVNLYFKFPVLRDHNRNGYDTNVYSSERDDIVSNGLIFALIVASWFITLFPPNPLHFTFPTILLRSLVLDPFGGKVAKKNLDIEPRIPTPYKLMAEMLFISFSNADS